MAPKMIDKNIKILFAIFHEMCRKLFILSLIGSVIEIFLKMPTIFELYFKTYAMNNPLKFDFIASTRASNSKPYK